MFFHLMYSLFPYFHSFQHLGDGRQHGSIKCENWRLAFDRPISAPVAPHRRQGPLRLGHWLLLDRWWWGRGLYTALTSSSCLCWLALAGIMFIMAACMAATSEASTAPFVCESALGIGLDVDRFKSTASSARMACSLSWFNVVGRWGTTRSRSLWWSPFLANSVTANSSNNQWPIFVLCINTLPRLLLVVVVSSGGLCWLEMMAWTDRKRPV